MNIDAPANLNYAAQVIRIPVLVTLPGLDNLIGIPVLGHQALTQKGKQVGDLAIAFTSETQLADGFAHENSLYRHEDRNKVNEKGYLEDNRRIRAIKLRGHQSNALLMPLDSVAYTGVDLSALTEGTVFDKLNGHDICNKYELPVKAGPSTGNRIKALFRRVTEKMFPEHLSTDNYFRSAHLLDDDHEVIVTQKLHGTSFRAGRVPVVRQLSKVERVLVWARLAEVV